MDGLSENYTPDPGSVSDRAPHGSIELIILMADVHKFSVMSSG